MAHSAAGTMTLAFNLLQISSVGPPDSWANELEGTKRVLVT